MDIKILHMIAGAKEAKGLAVIIDVFRAFSLECYFMNNNAATVIPVGSIEEAYRLKEENPTYLLAGEQNGKILEGFDYGNSPTQIENTDFTGKTIIHTTTRGTKGIDNAINADQIITGSLVNAKAIVEYIKKNNFNTISLVCMGELELVEAAEDNLCAEYIKAMLENRQIDIETEMEKLKYLNAKRFFDKNRQDIYPERDFYLCIQANKFDFVLKVEKNKDGLDYINKISTI